MSLINYTKSKSRRNGGIRTLGLIDRNELATATYSTAEKGYVSVTLDEDCFFAKFEFREDEAEYKEEVLLSNGAWSVTHELRFTLDKMGNNCSPAIATLTNASLNGMIALVVTNNGDTFLVGYSPEFGKERPLRLHAADGTTGRKLSDGTREIVVLRSEDVSKAMPLFDDTSKLFQ